MTSLRVPTPARSVSRSRRLGLLSLGAAVILLVGCSGIPAPTACYQITGATVHAVDTGMSVAGDLYKSGKLSEGAKVKLIAAHDIYRPAAQSAVAACKVVQNQGDVDKVVAQLKIASDKLMEALVAAGLMR